MNAAVIWKEKMAFDGQTENHSVSMDAKSPLGESAAATPKELVALGLGGCTAMDVIALLKKHKQVPTGFRVNVEIQPSSGAHPVVFESARLNFIVDGEVDAETLKDAVHLSQTKYCGVSAMLTKALPIEYKITLNGTLIATGRAEF